MKASLALHNKRPPANYTEWLATQTNRSSQKKASFQTEDLDTAVSLMIRHKEHIERLIKLDRLADLSDFLDESLHQLVGELGKADIHQYNNDLVEAYLDSATQAIQLLADRNIPGISTQLKLKRFIQVEKNFGRPALMLSGGGTFGIAHMGVINALLGENLLPDIISGTSMGSIAAGMVATHTDSELKQLLKKPERTHYKPLLPLPFKQKIKQQAWLDERQLTECIERNVKPWTFGEAYDRTGRSVSITISPTRSGQKPRILNHLTAPDVLISTASKASCSVPGLFPPATLKARKAGKEGLISDYLPSEKWCDGVIASDIPRQRISRLFNVNYFIVSQVNPHILPFVAQRQKSGILAMAKDLAISSALSQGNAMIKLAQRRSKLQAVNACLRYAELLLDQDYLGDITIHPEFPMSWYRKFMINPNKDELYYLIQSGEQAAWPHLRMIKNQTRISQTLRACIAQLSAKLNEHTTTTCAS